MDGHERVQASRYARINQSSAERPGSVTANALCTWGDSGSKLANVRATAPMRLTSARRTAILKALADLRIQAHIYGMGDRSCDGSIRIWPRAS
jgi:hypothetical protein